MNLAEKIVLSIHLLKGAQLQARKTISAADCPECRELVSADSRDTLPRACPLCGRPTTEAVREFYLIAQRRKF